MVSVGTSNSSANSIPLSDTRSAVLCEGPGSHTYTYTGCAGDQDPIHARTYTGCAGDQDPIHAMYTGPGWGQVSVYVGPWELM